MTTTLGRATYSVLLAKERQKSPAQSNHLAFCLGSCVEVALPLQHGQMVDLRDNGVTAAIVRLCREVKMAVV